MNNVAPYYAAPVSEELPAAEPRRFEVKRVLADAYHTFCARPLALAALINLGLGLSFACDYVTGVVFAPRADAALTIGLALVAHAAQLVLNAFFTVGVIRVSLAAARREPFALHTLFSGGDVVVKVIGSNIAATFLVLMALLLLIVPGFVLAIGFAFALHLIADGRADAIDSLWSSLRITRGQRLRLLLLALASVALIGAGVLLLGIGVLAALPIAYLAWAHAYVTILGE